MRSPLQSLIMAKYERLMPRLFPGARTFELQGDDGQSYWLFEASSAISAKSSAAPDANDSSNWSPLGPGIERRLLPGNQTQFRSQLQSRSIGRLGWLVVGYDTRASTPMSTAPAALRRAFADAAAFLQDDVELQNECDLLAKELTERYEELNLVYSTKDEVEYLEEGQEALAGLVHNCADYLDVGLAALICPERNIAIHSVHPGHKISGTDGILEILATSIYDRVESQIQSVILNDADDAERTRLFAGRNENLLAYPVVDDHGAAIGVIAVVCRRDKHTFSNGDRNLLEVMSKKASRIIYTHHDSLTGLINRSGFEPILVTAVKSARSKNLQHSLLHIDVDQLHLINDLMGHQEGDALIRRTAKAIRSILRESDVLARLGSDEFSVLLSNCPIDSAHTIAEKIREAVSELTVVSASRQLDVTVSIGAASIGPGTEGIVGVMSAAEIACKSAKEGGRDRVQVFAEDNTSLIRRSEEIEWIGRVQQALRNDEFQLYCQPVMPVDSQRNKPHFEILLRLLDADGTVLTPNLFIPAAERYQLMPQIDRWVIRNAIAAIKGVNGAGSTLRAVFCINLSGQSLTNPGFLSFVVDEIEQSGIPTSSICFEITETAAISNIDEALEFMTRLRDMGCGFSLDDFGAGLSSFGYLKMLPVDYIKIDGSFIREVTSDQVSLSMVKAICQIGRTMGLDIVAEFVGDEETVSVLKDIGVDFLQGFHIGKPQPLVQATERLAANSAAERA